MLFAYSFAFRLRRLCFEFTKLYVFFKIATNSLIFYFIKISRSSYALWLRGNWFAVGSCGLNNGAAILAISVILYLHDAILCSHDAILCSHDAILYLHDAILCSHDAILRLYDAILCLYDAIPLSHDAIPTFKFS